MATITDMKSESAVLNVTWEDGITTEYPWIWLRENAHDEATLHPVTLQRNIHTASIPRDIAAISVESAGENLAITWNDGDESTIPVAFLAEFRVPDEPSVTVSLGIEPILWNAETIQQTPSTPYDDIMNTDEGMIDWLTKVLQYGFALAVGVPATTEATKELLEKAAYIRQSIFGGFWSFEADMSKADTAYTNIELLSHTDSTYCNDAPVQLLHCIYFEGEGGSRPSWTASALRLSWGGGSPALRDSVDSQGSRPVHRRRRPPDGRSPGVPHDDKGNLVQVSFNNADRAPFLLPPDDMVAFYDALREFEQLVE